jgi:amino acid transporter
VYNLTGTWFTLALALVYVAANIGLPIYYRREHPDEFSILKHVVVPLVGTIGLVLVVFYSVHPLRPGGGGRRQPGNIGGYRGRAR